MASSRKPRSGTTRQIDPALGLFGFHKNQWYHSIRSNGRGISNVDLPTPHRRNPCHTWLSLGLFGAFLLALPVCQSTYPLAVWSIPLDPRQPYPEPLAGVDASLPLAPAGVELHAAINEVIGFRFGILATDRPVPAPSIEISPLTSASGTIEAASLEVLRIHRVHSPGLPGWHLRSIPPGRRRQDPLDVLVPLRAPRGGIPGHLEPGRVYDFWVDLRVPKGTSPGAYRGRIDLLSGGRRQGGLEISLQVWPMVLPDEGDVEVIAELDHGALFQHHIRGLAKIHTRAVDDWRSLPAGEDMTTLLLATIRTLQRHRLTPVLHKLSPKARINVRDEMILDWSFYDTLVRPMLNGRMFSNRMPLRHWPLPTHNLFASLRSGAAVSASGFSSLATKFLSACAKHFEEQDWLNRSYTFFDIDNATALPSALKPPPLGPLVRQADPRLKILTLSWPQDLRDFGWTGYQPISSSHDVDIWAPPGQFFDPSAMDIQRGLHRQTWLTVDRPPFTGSLSINAPATYRRVLSWQALHLSVPVLRIGCINDWPDAASKPDPSACLAKSDTALIFPGEPFGLQEPVLSLRIKQIRRSLQDAAFRKLLNIRGVGHISEMIVQSLAPYAGSQAYRTHFADGRAPGWPESWRAFELAREIMADAVLRSVTTDQPDSIVDRIRRSTTWRRFLVLTRTLGIRSDGVRVRYRGSESRFRADLEFTATIENKRRTPFSGNADWGTLPDGWSHEEEGLTIHVPPNASQRITLSALASTFPTDRHGTLRLPIRLEGDDGEIIEKTVKASFVTAVPFTGPLTIDGSLGDWPPSVGNVASKFSLITGEEEYATETTTADVPARTLVFVMRDADSLYIGVNAMGDVSKVTAHARSNVIRYDDLIPRAGELIEILLDPLNAGTRSPGDLYHIAVKPSGTYTTEHGIRTDPPCGDRSAWPADLEVATRIEGDRWTVEMRLPFAALEDAATQRTIWGFNVTRFEGDREIFSTWSGAVGNAYDPLSLGNLYLP